VYLKISFAWYVTVAMGKEDVHVGVIMAEHVVRDSALRLHKLVESKGGVSELNSARIH